MPTPEIATLASVVFQMLSDGRLREAIARIEDELSLRATSTCDEILTAYRLCLPMLPGVSTISTPRRRTMAARWREHPEAAWWDIYFRRVARSPFLTGTKPGVSWKASFDWLLKPANMIKIIEGNYDPPRGSGFLSESDDLAARLSQ